MLGKWINLAPDVDHDPIEKWIMEILIIVM